ncbi:MAG: CpsD/CapB family tyrosine-protein kinase [Planctomycetota bacterium]|jgi:capsular exopolysaccharide synthesis family protein
MSNIEKAINKSRKEIKKPERTEKAQSDILSNNKVESPPSQNMDAFESEGSIQGHLRLNDLESQSESKLNKGNSHIFSAVEKRDDEKNTKPTTLISEDYDQLMEDSGLVSQIQDIESKKAKSLEPAAKINCGNVDEHIVSYYENIGQQTWKGPVMVNFRRLQVSLNGLQKNNLCKVMVFTSSRQKEGKSTISLNTAITLCSDKEKKIAFVDCDFRKPTIDRLLDFSPDKGLSDYLLGEVEINDILYDSMMPNLTIVPAGNRPSNTCELFSSSIMVKFISHIREHFDLVIIDTPPVLAFPDTVILAPLSDGVVLVVNCKKAKKNIVKRAVETLSDNKILGFILNQSDDASSDYYGYSSSSGYGNYYYDDE